MSPAVNWQRLTARWQQPATWRRLTGRTGSGKPIYAADVALGTGTPYGGVRWLWRRRLIRNQQGQEVVSEGSVYTRAPATTGDVLIDPEGRAWTITTVIVNYDLDGTEIHREAML